MRAPFVGTTHEGRSIAASLGRVEVEVMTGDHAAFAGVELQELRACLVGFRQDFVLERDPS